MQLDEAAQYRTCPLLTSQTFFYALSGPSDMPPLYGISPQQQDLPLVTGGQRPDSVRLKAVAVAEQRAAAVHPQHSAVSAAARCGSGRRGVGWSAALRRACQQSTG